MNDRRGAERDREEAARRAARPNHVLDRIQACADGELGPEEEAHVRRHCAECPTCAGALAEIDAVYHSLGVYEDPRLPRPIWPAVLERIERRRSPFARVPFAASASAAAAAGLLIGLLIGSGAGIGAGAEGSGLQGDWNEVGTLLTDAGTTLDDLYLADGSNGGEAE